MQQAPMNSSDGMASPPPVVVIKPVTSSPSPPVSVVVVTIVIVIIELLIRFSADTGRPQNQLRQVLATRTGASIALP
jgi:hypothetical protein